jgi:hypothetical protein
MGLAVVVGDSGTILTSSNGFDWTPRVSGTTLQLRSVARANGRWIAVGLSEAYLESSDGFTWTPVDSLFPGWISDGRGRPVDFTYVGVRGNHLILMGSLRSHVSLDDGVTWAHDGFTIRLLQFGVATPSAIFVGGIYAAPAGHTVQTVPFMNRINDAGTEGIPYVPISFWTGRQLVSLSSDSVRVSVDDASTWQLRDRGVGIDLSTMSRVVWTGSLLVAVGTDGAIVTSPEN